MTSPVRSFTNPACTRKGPFYQVADSRYGGCPPFIGLCRDICTAFLTAPAGTPHPPPPGMGKADRLGQRVPLLSVYFPSFSNSLRKITDISFYTSNGARS